MKAYTLHVTIFGYAFKRLFLFFCVNKISIRPIFLKFTPLTSYNYETSLLVKKKEYEDAKTVMQQQPDEGISWHDVCSTMDMVNGTMNMSVLTQKLFCKLINSRFVILVLKKFKTY